MLGVVDVECMPLLLWSMVEHGVFLPNASR
jgi:hypothetical protein